MKFGIVSLALLAAVQGAAIGAREAGASLFKAQKPVTGNYIVVFKEGHALEKLEEHFNWLKLNVDGDLKGLDFFNISSFKGYTAQFNEKLLDAIRADPLVDFVEEDSHADLCAVEVEERDEVEHQKDATWGLSRISHRNETTDTYTYASTAGEGVTAYILDSGMDVDHPDFGGRAYFATKFNDDNSTGPGPNGERLHGTHVMGTVGSNTWGVAKKANLAAVQITDADGTSIISRMVKGVAWAIQDHQKKLDAKEKGYKGAVINLSWVAEITEAQKRVAKAAYDAGMVYVAAAGNNNKDTCKVAPASSPYVIAVANLDKSDKRSSDSNWGSCADIFAPGTFITSVRAKGTNTTLSGTSMSSPHVAGVAAYFLSLYPGLGSEFDAPPSKGKVMKLISDMATKDIVTNLRTNTTGNLLYNGGAKYQQIWS